MILKMDILNLWNNYYKATLLERQAYELGQKSGFHCELVGGKPCFFMKRLTREFYTKREFFDKYSIFHNKKEIFIEEILNIINHPAPVHRGAK